MTASLPSRPTGKKRRRGLFGGQPGLPGVITIYPGTDQEAVIDSKKSGTTLKSGGVLRCQMPGAGGYGNPLERGSCSDCP